METPLAEPRHDPSSKKQVSSSQISPLEHQILPGEGCEAPGRPPYLLVAPFDHGQNHPVEIQDAPADDVEPLLLLLPPQLGENEFLPNEGEKREARDKPQSPGTSPGTLRDTGGDTGRTAWGRGCR